MDRTFEDAFKLLCGEKIGGGAYRDVFECRLRPDLVVKVEQAEVWRTFANVVEMRFWCEHQYYARVADWLAPCEFLSPDGRILLQRRAKPVTPSELPARVPAFLTDLKPSNFGELDGRIVCVDYNLTIHRAPTNLKTAKWVTTQ